MATDPEQVVTAAFERLNAHDLVGYYDLCADDFIYVGSTVRVERLLVSGDTVAVWLTFGGTPSSNGQAFAVDSAK